MLMRGDLQKIYDQINPVFEGYNKRVTALEEEVKALKEAQKAPSKPKTTEKAKKVA